MYMTLSDFQSKLNNIIRDLKVIDKNTLVVSAYVAGISNTKSTDGLVTYPPGTVVLVCQDSIDKEGRVNQMLGYSGQMYELYITPDKVSKWKN